MGRGASEMFDLKKNEKASLKSVKAAKSQKDLVSLREHKEKERRPV